MVDFSVLQKILFRLQETCRQSHLQSRKQVGSPRAGKAGLQGLGWRPGRHKFEFVGKVYAQFRHRGIVLGQGSEWLLGLWDFGDRRER